MSRGSKTLAGRLSAAVWLAGVLAVAANHPAAAVPSSEPRTLSADEFEMVSQPAPEPERRPAVGAEAAAVRAAAAQAAAVLKGRMIYEPTAQQLTAFYPDAAKRKRPTGIVRIACKLTVITLLEDCAVRSEYPHGQFFADAALQSTFLMRVKPPVVNGKPVGGTTVVIPVIFEPPSLTPVVAPVATPKVVAPPVPPPERPALHTFVYRWWPLLVGGAVAAMLAAIVLPKLRRPRRKPGQLA